MNTISFYLEAIKNQLTEQGLITAIFTLSAAAFTFSVVSACARSDCEKVRPSVFPFIFNILTAVAVYFLCVSTPMNGPLEKYRQGDVFSFSVITAFVCFFSLTSLYGVALLILTPKKKKREKKENEAAVTCGMKIKRRYGRISETPLPVYPVSTGKLGVTQKAEKINFSAVKEILDQIDSVCPPVVCAETESIRERIFPYESVAEGCLDFSVVLPEVLRLFAKFGYPSSSRKQKSG